MPLRFDPFEFPLSSKPGRANAQSYAVAQWGAEGDLKTEFTLLLQHLKHRRFRRNGYQNKNKTTLFILYWPHRVLQLKSHFAHKIFFPPTGMQKIKPVRLLISLNTF